MRHLGNNHVGSDPAALGFPSIKACQAVVCQTSFGLFGLHDMKGTGGAEVDRAKAQAFAQFVQENGINHGAHGQRLYGLINRTEQYGTDKAGLADWATMLLGVAKALHFKGPIFRHRIVTWTSPETLAALPPIIVPSSPIDPLEQLAATVDCELFRAALDAALDPRDRTQGGRASIRC